MRTQPRVSSRSPDSEARHTHKGVSHAFAFASFRDRLHCTTYAHAILHHPHNRCDDQSRDHLVTTHAHTAVVFTCTLARSNTTRIRQLAATWRSIRTRDSSSDSAASRFLERWPRNGPAHSIVDMDDHHGRRGIFQSSIRCPYASRASRAHRSVIG